MICAISLSCPWHYAYRICSNYLLQCGLPGWADTFIFAVNPTYTSIVVINNTANRVVLCYFALVFYIGRLGCTFDLTIQGPTLYKAYTIAVTCNAIIVGETRYQGYKRVLIEFKTISIEPKLSQVMIVF